MTAKGERAVANWEKDSKRALKVFCAIGYVEGRIFLGSNKLRNFVYNFIGLVCVVMGTIGVFVPLWPTTVFAIVASIMFAKANPKLHSWLMQSRLLGPYLQNYHNKIGITMAYKIRTCIILWSGLMFSSVLISVYWVYIILAVVGISVTAHVFWIRTRLPEPEDRISLAYNLVTLGILWIWLAPALIMSVNGGLAVHTLGIGVAGAVLSAAIVIYALMTRRSYVHSS